MKKNHLRPLTTSDTSPLTSGFTLIELLVVIFIIGILAVLIVSNLQGARQRARDTKRKSEANNFKTALRLYYNDYQNYPVETWGGARIAACGQNGDTMCPVCDTAYFAAGGSDGCQTIYMKNIDSIESTFRYYQCPGGDDFRLKVDLENLSDAAIAASQTHCPAACGATYSSNEYILCAD